MKKITDIFGNVYSFGSCPDPITIDRGDGFGKQTFGCGKCEWCRSKNRHVWNFRLNQQLEYSSACYFVTLTYSDDNLSSYFNKEYIKRYHKRLRKDLTRMGLSMKYYLISEYGSKTHRPHLHELIYLTWNQLCGSLVNGVPCPSPIQQLSLYADVTTAIEKHWRLGYSLCDPVNSARINYITHYHTRPKFPMDDKRHFRKPFVLASQGLGRIDLDDIVYTDEGFPIIFDKYNFVWIVVPSYYRRKYGIELPPQPDLAPSKLINTPADQIYRMRRRKHYQINYNTESF